MSALPHFPIDEDPSICRVCGDVIETGSEKQCGCGGGDLCPECFHTHTSAVTHD